MKHKAIIYSLWATLIIGGGIFLISWRQRVANVAARFLNEMEIGNNQGFANAAFEQMIKDVGWRGGEAWCMYFAKSVYLQAFPKRASVISKILTGSTQQSWKNAIANPDVFKVITDGKPMAGDIVIWQSTNNKSTGHAGIVKKKLDGYNANVVEGNSGLGGTREGQGVTMNQRYLAPGYPDGSLKLLGFLRLRL